MNICGVLVHANPTKIARVAETLGTMPGVEVHDVVDAVEGATAQGTGRLVVTVEDTADTSALDTLGTIHRTDGVIAAALVYHHFDAPQTDARPAAASAH